MLMERRCLDCVLNQIRRVCRFLSLDGEATAAIHRRSRLLAAQTGTVGLTAPQFSAGLYAAAAELSGEPDPYRLEKRRQNEMILGRLDFFTRRIRRARDPLRRAAWYALLGNVIDLGAEREFDPGVLFAARSRARPDVDEFEAFRRRLPRCRDLLYIGDNAGEAVLDRLFIAEVRRQWPGLRVHYAVRSQPAINDVLAGDACHAGLDRVATIVESGSPFAGVVPSLADPGFRRLFAAADLVVAKGQGNFETLETEKREIFFVFKIKCQVVADYLRLPAGQLVFSRRRAIEAAGRG